MKQINSPADFEAMLQAERAVVLVYSAWSGRSKESRRAFEQWHSDFSAQPAGAKLGAWLLSPDEQLYTWKWVNEASESLEDGEWANGFAVWLMEGSLICASAAPDVKTLSYLTNFVFPQAGKSAERVILQVQADMFDAELLKILCCPETHQELKPASPLILEKLNLQIAAGRLQNRAGSTVRDKIDAGLVRADGRYLYPVRENIPVLLIEESLPLMG